MRERLVIAVVVAYVCCGCAGVAVTSLGSTAEADSRARGFRYWQPAPFLFVRADGQGGLLGEIKWLPDTTQKMSARPYAFLASNEAKLDFSDGILTSATIKADETAVINASLTALGKVLTASAKGAADSPEGSPERVPVPHVYKIVIEGNTITLLGGPALGPDRKRAVIRATVPAEGGK